MQLFSSARRWRVFIVLSSAFCTLDLDAQKGDALGLVIQQWTKQGGAASDLEGALQSSNYTDPGTGVVHTYLRQRAAGIPVFPGIFGVHTAADGTLLKWDVPPVAGLKEKAVDPLPVVTARAALENVAAQERVQMPGLEEVAYDAEQRRTTFRHSDSDEDPTVALVWWPTKEGVTLAWQVDVPSNDGAHWWIVLVDAKNGALLARYDRVISCSFGAGPCSVAAHTGPEGPSCLPAPPPPPGTPNSYSVFAFPARHPEDGVRSTVTAPWSLAPNASPFGWHDTNGAPGADHTNTTGNNVRAYHDTLAQNLPSGVGVNGGTLLSFDAPLDLGREPHAYLDAAIIQLFYANNMCHDVAHSYGFHAAAGNFQENNYGHGGVAGDAVQAQAQDGTGTNNANFFTPQDGRPGRMQMYRWAYTTPMRDSDLDNLVIAHEYAHGISNRLVGGPMNVDCLWNAEQMGEGWSDYFGLMLTMKPGDQGTGSAGVGNYLRGQPATGQGIRPAPYSTDLGVNAYTYANTNAGVSQPHGIGFVWCTMLWEMTWDLIAQYGFDPDLYNGAAGNNRALRLVVEAMKLTPCEPGFVDARNAILEADRILYGGADQALIWAAFARRGLGFSADQGDPDDRTDQVEAFDLPPAADVELLYLLSPEPGHVPTCALGILNVECVVRNLGTAPQGLIPVQYRVDNGPVQGTILGGPLQPGQRDTLTFSGQITGLLQTAGTHIVQVWTALSGDGNLSNDTATAVVTTYAAPFIALPYTENFEQEAIPALNLPCDQVGLTNGWYNVPEPYYASYSSEGESLNMRVADGLTRPQPDPYNYPEFDHTSGSSSGHYLRADPGCKQNNANGKEARLISPCFSTNGIIAPKFDLAFWMNIGSNTYFLVDGWWNGRWHQLSEGQVRPDSVETWNEARITLPANIAGNMVLRLMIKDDVSEHSCLDDIRLHDTFEPLTAALAVERGAWCRGEVVRLSDASLNADPTTTWTWSVSPTTYVPLNGTDLHSRTLELMPLDTGLYQVQLIAGNGFDADTVELAGGFRVNEGSGHSLLVRTDQWGSDLTWQVRTPGGAVHASGGPYTDHPMIGTYPQAIEQFCLPGEGCYELVLNDPFDGICCDYGNGSVELFDANGHLLVQGTMNDTEIPQKVFPFCTPAACIQLPWSENFESGHAGWTQDPTDNSDWSWSNAVITSSQGSDHTTGSGYSYQLRGGGTVQRHAQLRSPCIDLNGAIAPVLSFWYMDHPLSGDTLFLDLERNGHVYEGIWQSPYGSSGAWRQVTFDLSNYSGASITLQFRASKNFQGGSGIALDDLQITGNAGLHFSLNMALEGPFDTNTGLMRDDLRTKGLLPLVEPYTALGHTHSGGGGNEEMAPGLLSTKGPHALVDWVLLELRDGNDPTNIVATKSALLRRDGTVVDITGSTDLAFPIPLDVYYLRAAHRNHLGSMLATGLEFDIPAPVLDFRDPDPSLILGAEARKLLGGTAVLWAGDVNGNGQIKYTGGGNDRDRILSVIGGVVPTTIASGYLPADVDLNGEVKYTGANNDRDRILQNIGGVVPTNTRNETMP